MKTAIILTAYNRPKLVVDAIESVLEQADSNTLLYIMDDGCNTQTRTAIRNAVANHMVRIFHPNLELRHKNAIQKELFRGYQVVWYKGRDRDIGDRRQSIPYSYMINLCLSFFLHPETQYVAYLCDDDYLPPNSLTPRVEFLDQNPTYGACFGKLKSIQFDESGIANQWTKNTLPKSGRIWAEPTGERIFDEIRGSGKHYFVDGEIDPATGLNYAEEGFWQPGEIIYGRPHKIDHNQILHRTSCLRHIPGWYGAVDARIQYWPENPAFGVGDAGFFQMLGQYYPFYGVDCWAVVKRYHAKSDGVTNDEIRE